MHRFHLLFPLPRSTTSTTTPLHASLSPPIPSIYLPGNHDLGLHLPSEALAEYARERFVESFGPTNGEVELGGWGFIWVDAMALLESGEIAEEAIKFVEGIAARSSFLAILSALADEMRRRTNDDSASAVDPYSALSGGGNVLRTRERVEEESTTGRRAELSEYAR